MTLDKSEAAEALAEIDASRARSAALYTYDRAAPYVFLTGALWFVADLLFQFAPGDRGWVWPVCSLVAGVLYGVIAVLQARRRRGEAFYPRYFRMMMSCVFVFAFIVAAFSIFHPFDGRQLHSFIGVVFALAYAIFGLWAGWRLLALGVLLGALSLFGFFEVHAYYAAYMAVVGGGALMLSALWLRKA
jgi:hypothetical protein